MNLPTLPKTSLIVLNTLCPCRRPDASLERCSCWILTQDQERGSLSAVVTPECKWQFHKIINSHQEWETEAIRLMRDYYAAVGVVHSLDRFCSDEELDRLVGTRNAMGEFLFGECSTCGSHGHDAVSHKEE